MLGMYFMSTENVFVRFHNSIDNNILLLFVFKMHDKTAKNNLNKIDFVNRNWNKL